MNLSDKEIKLFIYYRLLPPYGNYKELRKFLKSDLSSYYNNCIIHYNEGCDLMIHLPKLDIAKFSLEDLHFQHFVKQKEEDGFVYASLFDFRDCLGIISS